MTVDTFALNRTLLVSRLTFGLLFFMSGAYKLLLEIFSHNAASYMLASLSIPFATFFIWIIIFGELFVSYAYFTTIKIEIASIIATIILVFTAISTYGYANPSGWDYFQTVLHLTLALFGILIAKLQLQITHLS